MGRVLVVASAIVLSMALLHAAPARARLSEEYGYDYDQVWRAAVRLVAVDYRFPITDRDPDNGYVLFRYEHQGRSYDGSLELVRARGADGRDRVRVVVQVSGMPTYVERMMLDRFGRKLVDEYGPPRPARPAPPARPEPPPAEQAPEQSERS